jgi:hypothetical protein
VIVGATGLNDDNPVTAGAVITAVGIGKTDEVGRVAAAVFEIIAIDGELVG